MYDIKNTTSPIELTFKFDPLTRKAETKLASFVAQGNFPFISRINLEFNVDVNDARFNLLTGNEKVIFKPGTKGESSDRAVNMKIFVESCQHLKVTSSQPMRCKIDPSSLQTNASTFEPTASISLSAANFVGDQREVHTNDVQDSIKHAATLS